MSRKKFIGANWKMNPIPAGALETGSPYRHANTDIVVFPMVTDVSECIRAQLRVGAQYGRAEDKGAFTGDLPMNTMKSLGCTHVLCGHSERRRYHAETNEEIMAQVGSALAEDLVPVVCIGETSEELSAGKTQEVLRSQLDLILKTHSSQLTAHSFLIAYEPVWAIGSGKTPAPADANETHAFIRSLLPAADIRIIYGGSMTGENAADFLSQENIDGGLPGGASLKPDDFRKIVEAAASI